MRRGWLVRRMLVLADLVGITVAFVASTFLLDQTGRSDAVGSQIANRPDAVSSQLELLVFALSLPAWVVVAKLYGLYDYDEERADHSTADDLVGVFNMVTVGTWLLVRASHAVTPRSTQPPASCSLFWAVRDRRDHRRAHGRTRASARRRVAYVQNTIIVGAGDVGQLVARKLRQHPEYGLNLVGFVDDAPKTAAPDSTTSRSSARPSNSRSWCGPSTSSESSSPSPTTRTKRCSICIRSLQGPRHSDRPRPAASSR